MGTNTDLENAQAWVPTHKAPISMDVQGDPSYIDLTFKSDFTQRLSVYQPLTIKGTSARAAVAFKKYKYPSEKGSLVKLSERHCTSISPRGSEVAVGSSDNAVYIVNVQTGKFVRALASKQWGHTDWVTCVKYMDDGKVLSGGMDSKLCLWEKNMARCSNLVGHGCAISACATIVDGTLGISSSYDKTLKVWDLESSQKGGGTISCVGTFKGHQGPITKLCVSAHEKNIVSGSKLGEVILWDAAEGRSLVRCVDAHEGRVTAMQSMIGGNSPQREAAGMGEMFLTGGQDGILQVWDFRVKPGPVLSAKVHRSLNECSVAHIGVSHNAAGTALVVIVEGDKTLKILDPRLSFQALHIMKEHRTKITSLHVHGGQAWSGAINGDVIHHEASTGGYTYGPLRSEAKAGVRCMALAGNNKLAIAGTDGNVRIYSH